jgi:NAD(P)-dependent dehydrogenase (short-subunit alcohol dehydrogenase family)
VWDLDLTRFDKTLAINTKGVAIGVKYASRAMKDQEPGETGDRGWIVNTASIMGLVAVPNAREFARFLARGSGR